MSTFVPAKIACRCGETYPVEVATGLHISLRPDLRQRILDGEFHRFRCPHCATIMQIDGLLAFTDFPRRQWFTIAPGNGLPSRTKWLALARDSFEATMVRNAPEMVVGWGREMTRRLIFGLASLREKLVILDAGLDDRVIELLKIQLLRDLHDDVSPELYFHLTALRGSALVFERAHPDGAVRGAPIPRAMYDALAGAPELAGSIEAAFPDELLVDFRAILAPEAEGNGQLGA
jgi:hypothetical protein